MSSILSLPNPNLHGLHRDFAFHFGIPLDQNTAEKFSDVQFVCIGGTPGRMRSTCMHVARELYGREVNEDSSQDVVFTNDRYSGFKVGQVLCISHGMGMPSVAIMLHELFKLLQCAGCRDVTILRIGTSGGVGVAPGTVVLTEQALTTGLKPVYTTSNFGKQLSLPVASTRDLVEKLHATVMTSQKCHLRDIPVAIGKTYCAEDFYQGQGRLDGSFCDSTEDDKQAFLRRLYEHGVRNIEMESAAVLALAHRVSVKAAVVCVTLVDRFQSDLVTASPDQLKEWIQRPIDLVTEYIRSQLSL